MNLWFRLIWMLATLFTRKRTSIFDATELTMTVCPLCQYDMRHLPQTN